MFKLKYAKMCNNEIFDRYGIKPVVEDYFKAESNAFCIADGVTRDSINGEAVPYPESEKEVKEWIKTYPNPSGSYLAAKICAETFFENINKNIEKALAKKISLEEENDEKDNEKDDELTPEQRKELFKLFNFDYDHFEENNETYDRFMYDSIKESYTHK